MSNKIIPKISIIIPIYNAQQYLEECLESLVLQTMKEIEIILVNDGSTDNSQTICENYAEKDSRFILINQDNGGSAAARRTGMLAAKGEYIGFMDADDWAEHNMYEKMYAVAAENDVDIVFCNCYRDSEAASLKCNKYIRNGYYDREDIVREILPRTLAGLDEKGRNHVIRWANYLRLYRRALIEKYQIYNDPRFRRCQDLQLTFEATLHARSYYYIGDEYLYHNRVVTDSQSRGYTKDMWNKLRILIEKLYEDVENYTEQDLKEQMDLCAFFFAVNTCINEGKIKGQSFKEDYYNRLNEICGDPICERFILSVPYSKLSKTNKKFYNGFKNKDVRVLDKAVQQQKKDEKHRNYISKCLSIPCIRSLYIYLRKIK